MNKINIFSYAIADYKITDINVDIYFAPAVLDAYYSKEEVISLTKNREQHLEIFDGIFEIIKCQTDKYNTYEIWYDLIEYKGIELVWKSRFVEEKKTMYVEVLYSKGNHPEEETLH